MKGKMELDYDAEADILEIFIGEPTPSYFEEIDDDLFEGRDKKTGELKGYKICDILRPLKVFCFAKNPPSAEDGVLKLHDELSDFLYTTKLSQNHFRILHKNILRSKNALGDIFFSNQDKSER